MDMEKIEVRRKMLALTNQGDSFEVLGDYSLIEATARQFSKSRGIPVRVEASEAGAIIIKINAKPQSGAYPQIANLKPGESITIAEPAQNHQRIRVAASQFGKKVGVKFCCSSVGDAVLVTRLAADTPKASRWPMDGLANGLRLTFQVTPAEQNKVRLAATYKSKMTGWTIRCRLQDDGSMLVYRTDLPSAAAAE